MATLTETQPKESPLSTGVLVRFFGALANSSLMALCASLLPAWDQLQKTWYGSKGSSFKGKQMEAILMPRYCTVVPICSVDSRHPVHRFSLIRLIRHLFNFSVLMKLDDHWQPQIVTHASYRFQQLSSFVWVFYCASLQSHNPTDPDSRENEGPNFMRFIKFQLRSWLTSFSVAPGWPGDHAYHAMHLVNFCW